MARFFVGQRVRVVYAPAYPHVVGRETRISGVAEPAHAVFGYEWVVTIDGEEYGARSHSLEPILPDGHREGMPRVCKNLDDLVERLQEVAA